MDVLVNHLGYETDGPKRAVVEATTGQPANVRVVEESTGEVVAEPEPTRAGAVDDWGEWTFWTVAFDDLDDGRYSLLADDGERTVRSQPFEVAESIVAEHALSDVLYYFTSQRCSGAPEQADRAVPFVGDREGTADVRGGWYDASGDQSKYLSHLSYANYMNPQQIPMVVWGLLDALDELSEGSLGTDLGWRLREEALYGADYLVRVQDEAGYFYMTVFDQWSHDPDRREICAYEGQDGHKTDDYEAGYRQGGGVAIAALARASTIDGPGEYDPETYLASAIRGFDHLEAHNEDYLDDGTENVIDDYCALLAATELFDATDEERFATAATERARSLLDRQTGDSDYEGWWAADDGERPFYHAAEEGLPVLALVRYLTVLEDAPLDSEIRDALAAYWSFELSITDEVPNPFGYARGYAPRVDGEPGATFFLPHDNETGYWWQGENARIASLATAARRSRPYVEDLDSDLSAFARAQLDWILGCNPFDTSMVHGVGNGPPDYHHQYRNVPGGIVNGITAGFEDESDVAFLPEGPGEDHAHRWRWAEQWLPHATWFVLAVASGYAGE